MNRKQYYVALAVLAVAGLGGGVLGNWLFLGQAAFAQQAGEPPTPAEGEPVLDLELKSPAEVGQWASDVDNWNSAVWELLENIDIASLGGTKEGKAPVTNGPSALLDRIERDMRVISIASPRGTTEELQAIQKSRELSKRSCERLKWAVRNLRDDPYSIYYSFWAYTAARLVDNGVGDFPELCQASISTRLEALGLQREGVELFARFNDHFKTLLFVYDEYRPPPNAFALGITTLEGEE